MGLGEDSNSAMYILGVCVGVSVDGVDGVDGDSGSVVVMVLVMEFIVMFCPQLPQCSAQVMYLTCNIY